jgi:predicted nucleic-acid-binding Zn-ribbon protein
MLEHIFRNTGDIRLFDIMTESTEPKDALDFDEISDMLEYPEYKRIELEDSIDHLIREKILGIEKEKTYSKTGCKICKYTDMFKIPRMGEHKSHVKEEMQPCYIDKYYMLSNDITNPLRAATFSHILLTIEDEQNRKT